ncbi:MAG: BamA/TamA family outer membrane protein [Planctomycetaceae bacterium]|nr:BamA/TamA family outer membrane protein [Planctomycetaceae bacterium]
MTSGLPFQNENSLPPRETGNRWLLICRLAFAVTILVFSCAEPQPIVAQPSMGPAPGAGGPVVVPRRRYPLEETDEIIAEVKFEGLQTIVPKALLMRINSQPGKPLSPRQVREDVRKLYSTRWFYSVEPRVEDTSIGPVVIFRILERPIVQNVEFHGNKKYADSYLEVLTGLRKGSPYDVALNKEAARRIEREYKDQGYGTVEVKLLRGSDKNDREVVFQIKEGKKVTVADIDFEGNQDISSRVLKTKLQTKTRLLWFFGGKFDPSSLTDDMSALRSYYNALGYFDVEIEKKVRFEGDYRENVYVTYSIKEGPRYRIRNIELNGMRVLNENEIRREMKTLPGDYFTTRNLNEDISEIRKKYGEMGRINASVEAIPKFLETPGVIDLELLVDEDEVWRIRRVNVHITGNGGRAVSHTKESVIVNSMTVFPGDLANPLEIRRSEQRINRNQLFDASTGGPQVKFTPVPEAETRLSRSLHRPDGIIRGQSFEETTYSVPLSQILREDFSEPKVIRGQSQDYGTPSTIRGQSYENGIEQPGNLLWDNTPQGDPFGPALNGPPLGFVQPYREGDLDVYVQEARTGRLMFGAGVNSNSGLVGNIVLDERNFDLFRPPSSIEDILEGRAFRGGGQSFRLEAVPGSEVSRYSVSWTNPYFLDTNVSLGLSGFYYQRYFDSWSEQRAGGRVNFGYQFTPEWSAGVAFRLEDVQLYNPRGAPPPQDLLDAVGSNFLTTVRANATYDTRDSSFLPSEGHIVTAAYEQGYGEFTYPRVDLSASQFFTTYSRIDGQGKHILSFSGDIGWTGNDTPIFERYYAGGYSSFRGFDFRGVSPKENGVEIGGQFQALGSVQYMIPITADETFSMVAFTDFGTVEPDVSFDAFRLTVGGGIRLKIPAMGPVPMAFDWAVPILSEPTDDEQLFAFYVGVTR